MKIITRRTSSSECGCKNGCSGAIYGLGFLGALVYYVSSAATFGGVVLGILKAIVWPAFLANGFRCSVVGGVSARHAKFHSSVGCPWL
jgi:hypothetical protein